MDFVFIILLLKIVSNARVDIDKYHSSLDFDLADFPNYYDFYEEKVYFYVNRFRFPKINTNLCHENENAYSYDSFYCDSRTKIEFRL